MALVLLDRAQETATAVTTVSFVLLGASTGYQSLAGVGNGNTTYYGATDGTNWETGIGTYSTTGPTLTRTTILASSNSGAAVTFSGTVTVFIDYPASKSVGRNTGYFEDNFVGTFVDGIVVDYDPGSSVGRISVGSSDGIRFYNGGVGGTLLGEALNNGNWDFNGSVVVGLGSAIGGATNPLVSSNGSANNYVQTYVHNDSTGASASADLVCYPDNGTDASGWMDMGITSSGYADTTFTCTGPNEGYIFMSALSGSGKTGNFVYATDSTGTQNYHKWFVGGFTQATTAWKMQLSGTALTLALPLASTVATGTAPFTVASTTNVANLNASSLNGATFAAPGAIGSTTASTGAFTTVSASGVITSTVATGTAPFTVASTTQVANLNAATLGGATFAAPGAIGGTTPSTVAATSLIPSAGTASVAPIVLTAGTNLTTATAGSVEFDTANTIAYFTGNTTNGRGIIPATQYFRLAANGAATTTTIAPFFGTNSSIPLVANGVYEIEFYCYFLKNTAGTLTWTLTNSAVVTNMVVDMIMSAVTGIATIASPLTSALVTQTAAAAAFPATASLTTAVNHFAKFKVILENASSTSVRLNVTNSAGTVTPLRGSFWKATRITNAGTYAA